MTIEWTAETINTGLDETENNLRTICNGIYKDIDDKENGKAEFVLISHNFEGEINRYVPTVLKCTVEKDGNKYTIKNAEGSEFNNKTLEYRDNGTFLTYKGSAEPAYLHYYNDSKGSITTVQFGTSNNDGFANISLTAKELFRNIASELPSTLAYKYRSYRIMEKIYTSVNKLVIKLNEQIDVLNRLSARKTILHQSMNREKKLSFDNIVKEDNSKIAQIDSVFVTPLPYHNEINEPWSSFSSLAYTKSISRVKGELIAKYAYAQRNSDTPMVIIKNGADVKPQLGYLFDDTVVPFDIKNGGDAVHYRLTLDEKEYWINGDNKISYEKTIGADGKGAPQLNPKYNLTIGEIDSIDDKDWNSLDVVLPILGNGLDDYIIFIRYLISRYVITKVYESIRANIPKEKSETELSKSVKEFGKEINEISGISFDSNLSIMFNTLSNLIDDVLKVYIKNYVGISAKQMVDVQLNGEEYKFDTKITAVSELAFNESYNATKEKIHDMLLTSSHSTDKEKEKDIRMLDQLMATFEDVKMDMHHTVIGLDSTDKMCFDIDVDTLKKVIELGGDPNAKDSMGNVPLIYAIDMQHQECVEELLNSRVSGNSKRCENNTGETPLTYSMIRIKELASRINVDKLLADTHKKLSKEIITAENYPRILNRAEYIINMVIYLLNHQIQLLSERYYSPFEDHSWSFDDYNKLLEVLGIRRSGIPLIHNVSVESAGLNVYDGVKRLVMKKNKELESLQNQVTRYENALTNIRQELDDTLHGTETVNEYRRARLQTYLQKLTETKEEVEEKIRNLTTEIGNAPSSIRDSAPALIGKIKDALKQYDKDATDNKDYECVGDLYDDIFDITIEDNKSNIKTDLSSYYKLWKSMLGNDDILNYDSTQLLNICMIRLSSEESNDAKNIQDITAIGNYCSKVLFRYLDDYLNMPRTYRGSNYMLNKLVHIYSHVIKHTLCVNFYVTLFKLLLHYVTKRQPKTSTMNKTEYSAHIKGIMENILVQNEKNKLLNYVMGKMPVNITRKVLHLTEQDKIDSVDQQLKRAVKIITDNKTFDIREDHKFIKDVNEHIVPYFEKYFTTYIKKIEETVDTYLNSVYELSRSINIFNAIKKHVDAEEATKE
jgi:hypothetical protein